MIVFGWLSTIFSSFVVLFRFENSYRFILNITETCLWVWGMGRKESESSCEYNFVYYSISIVSLLLCDS